MLPAHRLLAAALFVAGAVMLSCTESDRTADRQTPDGTPYTGNFHDSVVIELTGRDSTSVLDLLRAAHEVEFRSTLSGQFVTSVDAVSAGSDCFWVYTVNDSSPSVACDRYLTSGGDRVKWHFRRFGE